MTVAVLPEADARPSALALDRCGYEVLPPDECLRLLAATRTGRLGLHVGALPTVVPVGFVLLEATIVIGALTDDWFRAATDEAVVAFEADDVDPRNGSRWSVVAVGVAAELTCVARDEAAHLRANLGPWRDPAGERLIGLSTDLLSGRRSSVPGRPAGTHADQAA